jgi:hypothetical protein
VFSVVITPYRRTGTMAKAATRKEVQAAVEQSKETPVVTAFVCTRGQKKDKKKDEPKVFHPYSLTEVTLYNDNAPISGRAVYAIIEETDHQVVLLYPWTLTKFSVPANDFIRGQGLTYWPPEKRDAPEFEKFDIEKLAKRMIFLMEDYSRSSKQYSSLTVRMLIAAIQGVPLEQVPLYKAPAPVARPAGATGEGKAPAGPRAEINPRKPGVIDTIKETIKGGASMEEILKALVAKFPDRRPESMTTTIKCQVRRDLLKKGLVIKKEQIKGRGEVYTWMNSNAV